MTAFEFDGSEANLEAALEHHRKGMVVLCHVCKSPLRIAESREEARVNSTHPGIFCPVDQGHVCIVFHLLPPPGFWDKLTRRPEGKGT